MTTKKEEQGLSLDDIGPLYEDIPYGERKLRVYGISAEGIFAIFQRFPEIRTWFQGGGKVDIKALVAQAPGAIAAVIAAATGKPGNEKTEETARKISVETQLDILEAAGRLTFKNGFGPFVARIVALFAEAKSVNYGRAPDTKSPPILNPVPPTTEQSTLGA